VLAHTVWVDCRQLAADAEQAEAAHQSAAVAARAELEAQAGVHFICTPSKVNVLSLGQHNGNGLQLCSAWLGYDLLPHLRQTS